MPSKPTKLVDASRKNVIQTGKDVDYPYEKEVPTPEILDSDGKAKKTVYQTLLKRCIPKFPLAKLERMKLEDLQRFFEELPDMIQEEIIRRYKDISP